MIIGIDFDNTIVSYDRVFHEVAVEQGLVLDVTPPTKNAVRDQLRRTGREDEWTTLQGYVYGCRMLDADLFPGVMECLQSLARAGHYCFIVSHKTRKPYMGPPYDLHAAAREFLVQRGLLDTPHTGLSPDRVYFELTKEAKLIRISALHCDVFLDDLPEIIGDAGFPSDTKGILFDPEGGTWEGNSFQHISSWPDFNKLIMREQLGA